MLETGNLQQSRLVYTPNKRTILLDVSDIYRPELNCNGLRTYDKRKAQNGDPLMKKVFDTYNAMHMNQTVDFVHMSHQKWLKFDHAKWTVNQALEKLNSIVDESDPDTTLPNIVHAYQTAERARSAHPDEDWLHLTGLIHDLGKVMAFWGEPQWAVVGDTYPVGCKPASSIVFRDSGTFEKNADWKTGLMKSELGMYQKHCGLENLLMSWGHDEYLYQVMVNHTLCNLPDEALYIIRFHSFYPWHSAGHYNQFTNEKDRSMLYWIKEFNKFDLYSKVDQTPNIDHLRTYYDGLIEKYVPGAVNF